MTKLRRKFKLRIRKKFITAFSLTILKNMNLYKSLIRPFLFSFYPETAHSICKKLWKTSFIWNVYSRFLVNDERLSVNLAGLKLRNPIGLAAGFDKNCELINGLQHLFGYLVLGSITLSPRKGNEKPRVIRYVKEKSIVNAMGLPNDGARTCMLRLNKVQSIVPLVVSVAGFSVEDYVECTKLSQPHVDCIEINIGCPKV